jgi:hypothetical protein
VSFPVADGDPGACAAACAADGRCFAWTFVKPGIQGAQAMCWLKSAAPATASNGCCISGVVREASRPEGGTGAISVTSATYGASCGVPVGNWTNAIAQACNGLPSCEFRVDVAVLGDPAFGCEKDFQVDWVCGDGRAGHASLTAEAYGQTVRLSCPPG